MDWDKANLPEGFERRFDPVKRKNYYVDHNRKTTQWRHPIAPQSALSKQCSHRPPSAPPASAASATAPAKTTHAQTAPTQLSASVLRTLSPLCTDTTQTMVLDVAFSRAFQAECATLQFTPREALLLLDALDVPLHTQELQGQGRPVEVPTLHAGSFAAALTSFAKKFAHAPSISEEAAMKGLGRIRSLVEGVWITKARKFILRLARPSAWSSGNVKALFVALLHLPSEVLSALPSGKELLELGRGSLSSHPTLLQARFAVYQHTLRLLEQWWEQGSRPGDDARALLLGPLVWPPPLSGGPVSQLPRLQPLPLHLPLPVKPKQQGSKKKRRAGKRAAAASASASVPMPTSPKRWGQVEPRDPQERIAVEVAPLEALLQAWVPLNRAYGWGVPLDVLTGLGGRVGGAVGALLALQQTKDIDGGALDPVKGCCWVAFTAEPPLEPFFGLPIVRRLPAQQPDSTLLNAVLVPLLCLRRARDVLVKVSPHGGLLSAADMHVGMAVRVGDAETLHRACERFEWWDRPPPEALEAMAGKRCEVVSVTELHSAHRVGVRVEATGAFDGLPVEALLPEVPPPASLRKRSATKPRIVVDVETSPPPGPSTVAVAWPATSDALVPSITVSVTHATPLPSTVSPPSSPLVVTGPETEHSAPAPALNLAQAPDPAPVAAKTKRGPRIKVRERGSSASHFRGPSSTDIVNAFYREALDQPPQTATWNPAFSVLRPPESVFELAHLRQTSPPVEAAPASVSLHAPRPAPHSPPAQSDTRVQARAKLAFSLAQFDLFDNATYDMGVRASADRKHEAPGHKKAAPRKASPAQESPVSGGPGKVSFLCPTFDFANAVYDIEPPAPRQGKPTKLTPGGGAREEEGEEGKENDDIDDEDMDKDAGAPLPVAVEAWDDGNSFHIAGSHYHSAQQRIAAARRDQQQKHQELTIKVEDADM